MSSDTALGIAVGSTNRVKIGACRAAFELAFPGAALAVAGFGTSSGVPAQPVGDCETRTGAMNRAVGAARAWEAAHDGMAPHFGVGLEGGVYSEPAFGLAPAGVDAGGRSDTLWCCAWMAVYEPASGAFGYGRTGSFQLPEVITALVRGGMELGHADDKVFGVVGSKEEAGAVGLLTSGLINRSDYYEHAMLLALIPFMKRELYAATPGSG